MSANYDQNHHMMSCNRLMHLHQRDRKECVQDHELNLRFLINHRLNLDNLKLISLFEQPQLNV